jgi:hypothetical protein
MAQTRAVPGDPRREPRPPAAQDGHEKLYSEESAWYSTLRTKRYERNIRFIFCRAECFWETSEIRMRAEKDRSLDPALGRTRGRREPSRAACAAKLGLRVSNLQEQKSGTAGGVRDGRVAIQLRDEISGAGNLSDLETDEWAKQNPSGLRRT